MMTYAQQPTLSFTFDDGSTRDLAGHPLKEWNEMILSHLKHHEVQATFFVIGGNKLDEKGHYLLTSWNEAGHQIANHTFSHPNFNQEDITVERLKEEILKTDSLIQQYTNFTPYFRFPYLSEGNTAEKISLSRQFLKEINYKNGHVTINDADWYIAGRLEQKLAENPDMDLEEFRNFYISHVYEMALFFEQLGYDLTGRHIKHTLLLHHNLASAYFLGDLITKFKAEGWNIVAPEEAYQDPIYQKEPKHAGQSLLWAIMLDQAREEEMMQLLEQFSAYKKENMEELGL
ncbi:polysaccharide deacetylase family protein [Algivirga pacifica]|uniref:Polysaccharide deacetylase family protein n=2 Tax=Algivirga pacifica TaxID=1162670 RepID=A0ABP9DFF7_9BACT